MMRRTLELALSAVLCALAACGGTTPSKDGGPTTGAEAPACIATGQPCAVSVPCCAGVCLDTESAQGICGTPQPFWTPTSGGATTGGGSTTGGSTGTGSSTGGGTTGGTTTTGGGTTGGLLDAGLPLDAGVDLDAGVSLDGGLDAGVSLDAGLPDAG